MEETTLSGQNGATIQTWPLKLRNLLGWKAALLLGLAAVCAVVFFYAFLPRITTPSQAAIPIEQSTRRASRTSPQEQALLHDIVQEMIAEGKLTPYPPASPEAQQAKSATPMTPKERIKHYEDVVTSILN